MTVRFQRMALVGALASAFMAVGAASAPSAMALDGDCNGNRLNTPPDLINNVVLIYDATPIRSGYSSSCGVRQTTSGLHNFYLSCWVKNAAGNYWYYGQKTEGANAKGWVYEGNIVSTTLPGSPHRASWHC